MSHIFSFDAFGVRQRRSRFLFQALSIHLLLLLIDRLGLILLFADKEYLVNAIRSSGGVSKRVKVALILNGKLLAFELVFD